MQANRGCQIKTPYVECFTCDKIAEEPKLCPRCGKGFCTSCLLLTYNSLHKQCPACGVRVRQEEFLQSSTVIVIVDTIATRIKKQMNKGEQHEHCQDHKMPLGYFCVECNHPLCADCGMLSNKHTGHRFVSYRDIYERIKKKVFDQFPRFDRKIKLLDEKKSYLRSKMEILYDEYRRYKKYFEQAYILNTEKVQTTGKDLEQSISKRQESNKRRLNQLEHLRDTIYEEMEKKTQLTLIRQSASLSESISALSCQESSIVQYQHTQQNIQLLELVPEYQSWTYCLENFNSKSGIVYSQPKIINGVEWRLKIYPKGNGLARQKYLSVFVEMTKALATQNKYEYRIQLVNPVDPSLTVKRQYCSSFQIGECWGYNQFQPLDQLEVKEYILNDSLLFNIGIRNRTYRSLVQDQLLFIENIKLKLREKERFQQENKIKIVKNRISQLRPAKIRQLRSPQKMEKKIQRSNSPVQEKQEIPFQRSQTYELIQQFLKKQVPHNKPQAKYLK